MIEFIDKHFPAAAMSLVLIVSLLIVVLTKNDYPYIVLLGFAGFFFSTGGIVGYIECYTKHIKKEK